MHRDLYGEHAFIASEFSREREYWLNKLSGDWEKRFFPHDFKNVHSERKKESVTFQFPPELFSKVTRAMNGSDSRLRMILTAGLVQLIDKYTYTWTETGTGNEDIVVGTPIDKQKREGEFVNTTLALKISMKPHMTFRELLSQTRQTIVEARQHQNYPIETLQYELNIPSTANENFPLFDIALLLENIQDKHYLRDLHINMVFVFLRTEETLEGLVEYNAHLYDRGTIERITRHYTSLLEALLAEPDREMAGFSLLSDLEKKQLVINFNSTAADYPPQQTLYELFQLQARTTPLHTAILDADSMRKISYRELDIKAIQLAGILREKGAKPGTVIPVMGQRKIEIIAGILGILKAGGAYLPIDATSPLDRIKFLIRDSSATIFLTQNHLIEKNRDLFHLLPPGNVIAVDEENLYLYQEKRTESYPVGNPLDPAYVIYTSGTTGRPKGVVISHQAALNYIVWAANQYVENEGENFPLYTSISFDMTVTSIFTPLITNNAIVLYGGDYGQFMVDKIIEENKVSILKLTPSHLNLIKGRDIEGISTTTIKRFILGGEELDTQLARDVYTQFKGKIDIYNEYGPTEATVGCMIYKFDPQKDHRSTVPIGGPVNNTKIYLLDKNRHPVPVGLVGEIYIAGHGRARGYLNRPELTGETFIDNPFMPGERIYRSGDLGRWISSNCIEFLGRRDHQVKIRGFRIEPGEIENQLMKQKNIKDALVICKKDHNSDNYLCAYIAARPTAHGAWSENAAELREYLSRELPDYMIPAFFVPLEEMPLTANGKVDRKALPEPEVKIEEEHIAPRNQREERLANIWSDILGIEKDRISIDSNFFQLGGHSLNATILAAKIHKLCDVKVPLVEIFERYTIRKLAEYIEGAAKEKYKSIEIVEKMSYYDVSYAQKRLWILGQLEPGQTAYNVIDSYVFEKLNKALFERVLKMVVKRHEILRTTFTAVKGEPKQKIHAYESLGFKVDYIDLRKEENPEDLASTLSNKEANTTFHLEKGPLLRAKLFQVNDERHIFLITMHHIISDGWSVQILINEVKTLYNAYDKGQENPLQPLKIQYKDFACWHNQELKGENLKVHREYWRSQFSGEIPVLNLKTDYPRPSIKTFNGKTVPIQMEKEISDSLFSMNQTREVSTLMILTASVMALLYKYTGQEDIIVGLPVSGREHIDLEDQVGFYINIMALRTKFAGNKSFENLLKKVKQTLLGAFDHQLYPFDRLVEELAIERDMSRSPLFDVVVQYINFEGIGIGHGQSEKGETMKGVSTEIHNIDYQASKYDLVFNFLEMNKRLYGSLIYNTDLFQEESIVIMIERLKLIFREIVGNPAILLNDLDIEIGIEKEMKKNKDSFAFEFD